MPRADARRAGPDRGPDAPGLRRDGRPALPAWPGRACRRRRRGRRRRSGRWSPRPSCSSRRPTPRSRCSRPRPWPWRPGRRRSGAAGGLALAVGVGAGAGGRDAVHARLPAGRPGRRPWSCWRPPGRAGAPAARPGRWRRASGSSAATLAWWAATAANPFVIWWWNQRNHARFYVEYPRSYLAWVAGQPGRAGRRRSACRRRSGRCSGSARPREAPRVAWATARRPGVPDAQRQEPERGRPALAPVDAPAARRRRGRARPARGRARSARGDGRAWSGVADAGPRGDDPGRLPGLNGGRSAQRKTCVTRTPSSVSIWTSSPRATSRPPEVSSTGSREWRPSSRTSPGLRSARRPRGRLTRPSSTTRVTGTSVGATAGSGRGLGGSGRGSWRGPLGVAVRGAGASRGSAGRRRSRGTGSGRESRPAVDRSSPGPARRARRALRASPGAASRRAAGAPPARSRARPRGRAIVPASALQSLGEVARTGRSGSAAGRGRRVVGEPGGQERLGEPEPDRAGGRARAGPASAR